MASCARVGSGLRDHRPRIPFASDSHGKEAAAARREAPDSRISAIPIPEFRPCDCIAAHPLRPVMALRILLFFTL